MVGIINQVMTGLYRILYDYSCQRMRSSSKIVMKPLHKICLIITVHSPVHGPIQSPCLALTLWKPATKKKPFLFIQTIESGLFTIWLVQYKYI